MRKLLWVAVVLVVFGAGLGLGLIWQNPSQANGCITKVTMCTDQYIDLSIDTPYKIKELKTAKVQVLDDSCFEVMIRYNK